MERAHPRGHWGTRLWEEGACRVASMEPLGSRALALFRCSFVVISWGSAVLLRAPHLCTLVREKLCNNKRYRAPPSLPIKLAQGALARAIET